MPPKRSKRRGGKRGRGRGNMTNRLLSAAISTIPFRGIPFVITQGTTGNGGITNENSGSSLTNANIVNIDPFNFGSRMSLVADQFLQYRFKSIKFTYNPRYSSSGVAPNPAGATTTPSYGERSFVWGVVDDPALLGSLSFQVFLEYGGQLATTTRKNSMTIRGGTLKQWRYTSTTTSSPTAIDLRMVAPMQLRFYFDDTSSTAAATYGYITYEAVVQFRGAANNASIIGVSSPAENSTDDDKKAEDSPVVVGAPAKIAPGTTTKESAPVESSDEKALADKIHDAKWPVPWLSTIGRIGSI